MLHPALRTPNTRCYTRCSEGPNTRRKTKRTLIEEKGHPVFFLGRDDGVDDVDLLIGVLALATIIILAGRLLPR